MQDIAADGKINLNQKKENKRIWIYPKLIKGTLYHYRDLVSYVLLTMLFAWPFVRINGDPPFLFNILERKFIFFSVVFMPQDFYLFVLAMLTFIVFIILFTAIFGRLWCGWSCPQTIFMEMVFRKIEYWIEGTSKQQKLLNDAPLSVEKVLKKAFKHLIFILISFFIANIFLAYIIGSDELFKIMKEPVEQHKVGFTAIVIFTGIFYLVFARIRELVCTVICPYGRLQGVLLDRKTLVVAYDYMRGEPRGHLKKDIGISKGDCIDCDLCVQVCPTGIDIRKGTQLECINCTACIDVCDMVMDKISKPRKLIGFKSEEQIRQGKPFKFGKRVYAYAVILFILLSSLTTLLVRRPDIETTILRAGGTLYQLREDGTVSNLYNTELINKTSRTINFQVRLNDSLATIQYINHANRVEKGEIVKLTFFVIRPQHRIKQFKSDIGIEVLSGGQVVSKATTTFIAPPKL
jgi:cytochrome c oxidase accessory protein FixG